MFKIEFFLCIFVCISSAEDDKDAFGSNLHDIVQERICDFFTGACRRYVQDENESDQTPNQTPEDFCEPFSFYCRCSISCVSESCTPSCFRNTTNMCIFLTNFHALTCSRNSEVEDCAPLVEHTKKTCECVQQCEANDDQCRLRCTEMLKRPM